MSVLFMSVAPEVLLASMIVYEVQSHDHIASVVARGLYPQYRNAM